MVSLTPPIRPVNGGSRDQLGSPRRQQGSSDFSQFNSLFDQGITRVRGGRG